MIAMEIADRFFQFREGCDPYPYHDQRLPNICLAVNTLTPRKQFKVTCFSPPNPHPHALFLAIAARLQKSDHAPTPL
jgi:hypothetical protein